MKNVGNLPASVLMDQNWGRGRLSLENAFARAAQSERLNASGVMCRGPGVVRRPAEV
jgi:hypothetical protein